MVRDLMLHQQGQLSDDATLLMVEWRGNRHPRLLPQPTSDEPTQLR